MMRAALVLVLAAISVPTLADEKQIRRDCRRDAVRYCTAEAVKCAVAETPQCRAAVIACMISNRARLSPRCAAHIH